MEEKVLRGEVVEGEPPAGSTMPSRSGDPESAVPALPATSGAAGGGTLLAKAIACAEAGDVSALHFLYVRYADDVWGYVESIVRDRHEAEDVTQDVFAKLITAIATYEQREGPFAAWLLRVARDAALDQFRSRRDLRFEESA
jgi:Sigma-70 region 2